MRGLALAALLLTACAGPTAVRPQAVELVVRVEPRYALQAVVSAWSSADVDHVTLALHRDGGATPVATRSLPAASLTQPLSFSNLRADSAYELRAAAFADAAEKTLISDAAASRTAFRTPAVAGDTIETTTLALAIGLTLAPRPVGAHITYKVAVANPVRVKASHVRLTLLRGTSVVSQRVETLAQAEAAHVASGLALGQSYTLLAEGIEPGPPLVKHSADAKSSLAFTTPAAGGTTVQDDMNLVLGVATASVPCAK